MLLRHLPGALFASLLCIVACGSSDKDQPSSSSSGQGGQTNSSSAAGGNSSSSSSGGGGSQNDGWLHTDNNHILHADGSIWRGRGANLHDTRSCNACTYEPADVDEVLRRMDELVDNWGANFIRLDLESYAQPQQFQQHWASISEDPAYFQDVISMVEHAKSKDGLYVLLSLWVDPGHDDMGWPTAATNTSWQMLAQAFIDDPHVIYGIINEPEYNFDGSLDDQVWQRMNSAVSAIREVEDAMGANHHIIAVQGTGGWARRLDYYVDHPITAAGGDNIAYEIHIYNPASDFDSMLAPATTLPVIIGEHGPSDIGNMNLADCDALASLAQARDIPYLAWTFHQRCPPNLIEETASGCGIDMPLTPTPWGAQFKARLATPW